MLKKQIRLICVISAVGFAQTASAWQLHFHNADQQALDAFAQGHYAVAASLFTDPYNQGIALYRAGNFEQAVKAFATVETPTRLIDAEYNLGNTYYQLGEYDKALLSYQKVLSADPTHTDAQHNLALTQKRLEKPQQPNNGGADKSQQPQPETGDKKGGELDKGQKSQDTQKQDNAKGGSDNIGDKQGGQQGELEAKQQGQKSATPPDVNRDKQRQGGETPLTQPVTPPDNPPIDDSKNQQAEQGEETNNPAQKAALSSFATPANHANEAEMLADILLNRVTDNPAKLLQQQFQLDAEKTSLPPPHQPW
ncbi:tetratricopeptide repeat protein [Beggiatoa leptomitoformis]|uniref:Tetratricopeptide repeat protein n=1 Tax=Beggiatoa leptomitoformis TaxID=288004 RepID=A0A2N9Y9Z3_9GAMM|nr:tetratricopeptide repeat protein [Beggiatoa leptomitoformis]ALG67284.1 tetratricopeptide repeat protein [Beggiatoa leptomitoformis]AUI67287.1 tetratricopeptide repeat protein [Beggiatoa leptomitoformis]